jgi:hypothetical protein
MNDVHASLVDTGMIFIDFKLETDIVMNDVHASLVDTGMIIIDFAFRDKSRVSRVTSMPIWFERSTEM